MDVLYFSNSYDNILNDEALKDYDTMKRNKILEDVHKYSIYYIESEDAYRTYLPDPKSPTKRKAIKRKSKEALENAIVDFYNGLGETNKRENITLEDFFKEWVIYRRDFTSVKNKTLIENINDWNKFFRDTDLVKMRLIDIKPITLIRFFRKLTKDREYTHKRISNARTVLNGIFTYAIEEEIITQNPVNELNLKSFTYKPVEYQQDNVFSQKETETLLTYLKDINEPYALAIQLSFYLFIRVGETKAIKISDIDFEERSIYLHSQILLDREVNDDLTFSSRKVTESSQMKGNTSSGFRKQYLTDEALEIVKKALSLNPNGSFLFEPNGKVMNTDRFNAKLRKYCSECGIPYHSSHKIRFYNASTAFSKGTNIQTISKLMGHTQTATTMHYLRNVNDVEIFKEAFNTLGLAQHQIC